MPPLSREYLLSRGYCCGFGCLNCPYNPKHTKGSKEQSKDNNVIMFASLYQKHLHCPKMRVDREQSAQLANPTTCQNRRMLQPHLCKQL
jgi:hypothetical protein